MANNRMFITCSVCGEQIGLAKYYPSTGWYVVIPYEFVAALPADIVHMPGPSYGDESNRLTALDEWFDAHRHEDYSTDGPMHFSLTYECGSR